MKPEDYDLIIPGMRIKKDSRGMYRLEYVGAPWSNDTVFAYATLGSLLSRALALMNFVEDELKREGKL